MPDFVYSARSLSGENVNGKLTANSRREAIDFLAKQSLYPMSIEDTKRGHIEIKLFRKKVPAALIASTLAQLADLLENGVPVLTAFQVLMKQTTHSTLHDVLDDIHGRVSDGQAIDSAFAAHPSVFSDLTISIIRAGTEGAFLEESLKRTSKFLEQQNEMRNKIIGALIYPLVLAVVGGLLVTALLIVFVPQFEPMFAQIIESGDSLPVATTMLLAFRSLLARYGLYVIAGLSLFVFWIMGQLSTPFGKRLTDRVKLKLPLFGSILLNSAVARFCRVLGTLLENGVPILRSLDISSHSTGNSILSEAVLRSAENVSSGESLSKPLAETGIFPPQIMAMISVAEESNTLENVLVNIADSVEKQISRKLDLLVRLIEPAMLLCMAGAVLYIILALLLPMFQMGAMTT